MRKFLCAIFFLLSNVTTEGQLTFNADNICIDQSKKITSINWLDYKIKFNQSNLISCFNKDTSVVYDPVKKKISLPDLIITLKDSLIELHSISEDSTVRLNISGAINYKNRIGLFLLLSHSHISTSYENGQLYMVAIPVLYNSTYRVI